MLFYDLVSFVCFFHDLVSFVCFFHDLLSLVCFYHSFTIENAFVFLLEVKNIVTPINVFVDSTNIIHLPCFIV